MHIVGTDTRFQVSSKLCLLFASPYLSLCRTPINGKTTVCQSSGWLLRFSEKAFPLFGFSTTGTDELRSATQPPSCPIEARLVRRLTLWRYTLPGSSSLSSQLDSELASEESQLWLKKIPRSEHTGKQADVQYVSVTQMK